MHVLQRARDHTEFAGLHVAHGGIYGRFTAVRFRRRRQKMTASASGMRASAEADHHSGVYGRFHDGDDLRPRKAHVLQAHTIKRRRHAGEVARFQKPCEIMQRRVGVGAAHGFLKRRKNIVMHASPSRSYRMALRWCSSLQVPHGDARLVLASYGSRAKLCRVHCFCVHRRRRRKRYTRSRRFEPDFFAEVFRQNAECAVYGAGDLLFPRV